MGGRREKRRASSLDFEPWCAPDGGAGGRGGREGEKGRCEGGRGKEYGEYEDWELEEVARRLRGELKVVEGELGRRRRAKKGEKKVKKREKKMKEGKKEEGTVFQRVRGWFGRKGGGKMQIGVPKDAQKVRGSSFLGEEVVGFGVRVSLLMIGACSMSGQRRFGRLIME